MNNHRSHTTVAEPPPAEPRHPVDDEPSVHLRDSSRHDAVGHASHHGAAGPPVPADTVGGHAPPDGHGSVTHAGHDKHAGHDPEAFRRRFWWTVILTVPVVATSSMVMDWFGYHQSVIGWVAPLLGTVVFLWGGRPFLVGAVAEVRTGRRG